LNTMINWMGGWPKEGLVSGADWEERIAAISEEGRYSYRDEKLRIQLAQGLLKMKTGGDAERLRVTRGADDALAWILTRVLVPGDTILTECLTSRSALQAFRKAGMQVVAIQGDQRGMDGTELTAALNRYQPQMVYISPSCTDPAGTSWSNEIKRDIQHRCQEAGVLLVTDDRQELLLYDAEELSLADQRVEPGTLSIGQLPPGLIAGLRIGWIAGAVEGHSSKSREPETQEGVLEHELEHSALSQLIEEQPLEPLMEMLRVQCEERMKRMTEHLTQKRITDLTWVVPKGGLHLWVILPHGLEGEALLRGAWLKGLIFQPGAPFYVKEPHNNTLRITHAFASEREIKSGVTRLEESIKEFTGRWSRS
jgi:2-aminoadipate transaminase